MQNLWVWIICILVRDTKMVVSIRLNIQDLNGGQAENGLTHKEQYIKLCRRDSALLNISELNDLTIDIL